MFENNRSHDSKHICLHYLDCHKGSGHKQVRKMLKVWKKSWEPFKIYQLTSTANPAIFVKLGLIGCAS